MDRCPKCHKIGIEWDRGMWRCLWENCGFITDNYDEIKNAKHPIRFSKFIKLIGKKASIV